MKIMVTGGAGFIGSHVVDEYIKEGHEVLVIDNLNSGRREYINKKARFFLVDIRDSDALEKVFRDFRPDVINHHAAQISVVYSMKNPELDIDINIKGTLNLIELAGKYNVRKFIFASTGGALYGEPQELPCTEEHPILPLAPYGIDKATAEHYIRIYADVFGYNYVILRYANVYGPRQDPFGEAGVVAIFTMRMLKNQDCIIFGDGNQSRDFVFVEDVARANLLALHYEPQEDILPVFNIATSIPTTVNEIFKTLKELVSYDKDPVYEKKREGEVYKIYLSFEKARKYLGWSPRFSIKEGLKMTVEWFKGGV